MRILVLHQHYHPEIAASAQILSDICEELAGRGHDVTVVCGQPSYRQVDFVKARLPRRQQHRGVTIVRVPSFAPTRRGIPQRIFHYGMFFAASLFDALRLPRPDVALVLSTPPLLLGVSGALLRLLRDVPFVYSVQDLYPDVAVDLGVLSRGPVLYAIDEVAGLLYRAAAEVVTLSEGMAARLCEKGVDLDRLRIIPNWSDTDAVRPGERDSPLAVELGLSSEGGRRFVVLYSGNVGLSQGLEHLPEVAARTAALPVLYAVVGDGNSRQPLMQEVARRGLFNVRFLPPQPRERLGELLNACEVGWVPMKRSVGGDLVPCKLYGIMAAGRPVLASAADDTEVAATLRRHGCGFLVAPEDPAALADEVARLVAMPGEEREARGRAGRAAAVQHYSRRVCAGKYEESLFRAAAMRGKSPKPA